MKSIFHRYYIENGDVIDVFGYNEETERFVYSVETGYSCTIREAKKQYKSPDKRNERLYPYGLYINVILSNGKKHRLFLDN